MSDTAANLAPTVIGGAFLIALVFGWVASRANFCTMGAISDIVNMGHWGRMRMWLLAIAVAVIATTVLSATGTVKLSDAVTQRPMLRWLSLAVGGLIFGVGMTLAGGCVNRNLLRAGWGSVRSMVVLVFIALSAYMTLKGLFATWRANWLDPVAIDLGARGWVDQGLGTVLARLTGMAPATALLVAAAAVALPLLVFVFKDARFRANTWQMIGGLVIGLLVAAGWYVSGHLGFGENPDTLENVYFATNSRTLESLSFVSPLAFSLEFLLLWTDTSLRVTFGIATVVGVLLGAAAYALTSRKFHWEGFANLQDLRSHLIGAILMGFGGVTALGCTVGQGLSGLSGLAIGSFIATVSIVVGCVLTLKVIVWRAEA